MTSRVESHLTALTADSKLPGVQYVVVTSEGVLFEHYSGWADIRRHVPVDAATTMMAYSMSKTTGWRCRARVRRSSATEGPSETTSPTQCRYHDKLAARIPLLLPTLSSRLGCLAGSTEGVGPA